MIVPSGSVDALASNVTVAPGAETVAAGVNAAAGASMVIWWVVVALTPRSSVVVSVTVYIPGNAYAWVAAAVALVSSTGVSSPKFQL